LDPAAGEVLIGSADMPPLPDAIATDPECGWLDPRRWFNQPEHTFEIEIGSGKGTFLVQHAEHHPTTNFLGIEWAREFCVHAADRIRRRREADGSLSQVRMLNTDATEFMRWRMPTGIANVIHLYFSDPWPKKRHHKNRVVQHRFMADAWRILKPGGELRVVTDHAELWAWDLEHFDVWTAPAGWDKLAAIGFIEPGNLADRTASPFTQGEFEPPEGAGEGELVGTNFERKFRVEGRSFHSCTLTKHTESDS